MKTSFKFKNLIYSIILVPFVFAVIPQQNSSLEKTTDGNSALSTIDPAKSKNDSYIEQVAMGGGAQADAGTHSAAVLVDQNGNESLYTWGSNDEGQLGLGYTGNPEKNPNEVTTEDGGINYYATPQKVTGLPEGDIEQISLGNKYSAAIVNDGSGDELYTWGWNNKGQLGTGEGASSTNNLKPTKVELEGEIEQISTNVSHSAAIVNNGEGDELFTWGNNRYGKLGRGETTTIIGEENRSDLPGKVSFGKYKTGEYQIKDVSVGNVSSAAIITDNDNNDYLYTWGENGQKQLGINNDYGNETEGNIGGKETEYFTPQNITSNFNSIDITSFEDIAVGATSNAMVVVDEENNDQLYTWGSNAEGQLGIGVKPASKDYYWEPQKVIKIFDDDETDIEQISLYSKSLAVVMNSGNGDELWTWGDNDQGELGIGFQDYESTGIPVKIEDPDFDTTNMTQVTSGYQSRMAITNNGTSLYAWGDNAYGQLGVEGSYTSPHEIDFYSMIPDIPFIQKWYFYFILVILIFLIIGLIIGLLIYLKKRQLVR